VLQCVAVCCSVLQCVQCVAVCCGAQSSYDEILSCKEMLLRVIIETDMCIDVLCLYRIVMKKYSIMGWLRLVGSLK